MLGLALDRRAGAHEAMSFGLDSLLGSQRRRFNAVQDNLPFGPVRSRFVLAN
jgi:hypothetical protein